MDKEMKRRARVAAGDVLCALDSVKTLPADALASALALEVKSVGRDEAARFVRALQQFPLH